MSLYYRLRSLSCSSAEKHDHVPKNVTKETEIHPHHPSQHYPPHHHHHPHFLRFPKTGGGGSRGRGGGRRGRGEGVKKGVDFSLLPPPSPSSPSSSCPSCPSSHCPHHPHHSHSHPHRTFLRPLPPPSPHSSPPLSSLPYPSHPHPSPSLPYPPSSSSSSSSLSSFYDVTMMTREGGGMEEERWGNYSPCPHYPYHHLPLPTTSPISTSISPTINNNNNDNNDNSICPTAASSTTQRFHRPRALSSPASDLAARRGVFSRRHYGSVELLASSDNEGKQQNAGRFRVETGERGDYDDLASPVNSPIHLENPEFQTRWYFKYFMGKLHQNYICQDMDKESFLLSVVVTDANNHNVPQYRAILWRKNGAKKICLPYNPSKPQTVKGILGHFDLEKLERGPKEIFDPEIQKELLVLEEQEGSVNFKIGLLYAKDGQTSDDDFYSNEEGSEEFYHFVDLLGERVKLKGWDKFKAGLDIKSNTTGEESVYTVYEGHEIMFHVSTLLPFSHDNKQQVERKRHIGNDIVNVVFYDSEPEKGSAFKPNMMKTRFTHIFVVVVFNANTNSYRLTVFSEESVPLFGPPLPVPPIFVDMEEFRDFLLVKIINGEKAAVNNPLFAQKRERTLEMLLRNLYQEYMGDANKNNVLYRRAFSDVIQDGHGSHRKEEARRLEFVRVGQTLKLKTILKGDAPTSLITTGLLKREPWEPQRCHSDFPFHIICGDSWGDKLIVSSENGVMVLEEGQCPRQIFDRSMSVKQLSVVEVHGLLIMRVDKGKEGKLYVFRLNDFEGEASETVTRSRHECRDHRLDRTKGCHLYAVSRAGGSHLRVVACVGRRLVVLWWKHCAAWSAWCPTVDLDTVDSFTFLRELQCAEVPQLVTLIDGVKGDNQICVGYKTRFDLINEKNGDTLQLYNVEAAKVNLVSALDIYEDDEAELILSYNHVSHFQKLKEGTCHDFDFRWNSEPESIVCAFPYVMAFTSDSIEIRLIINGNLIHTTTMPNLTLITSKCDIYFASSACNDKKTARENPSPPASPSGAKAVGALSLNIYKIPLSCLAGQMTSAGEKTASSPSGTHGVTLLAPLVNNGDRSPSALKRSPLIRTKRVASSLPSEKDKDRHDSSSSDSGITILRTSDLSPPSSPFPPPHTPSSPYPPPTIITNTSTTLPSSASFTHHPHPSSAPLTPSSPYTHFPPPPPPPPPSHPLSSSFSSSSSSTVINPLSSSSTASPFLLHHPHHHHHHHQQQFSPSHSSSLPPPPPPPPSSSTSLSSGLRTPTSPVSAPVAAVVSSSLSSYSPSSSSSSSSTPSPSSSSAASSSSSSSSSSHESQLSSSLHTSHHPHPHPHPRPVPHIMQHPPPPSPSSPPPPSPLSEQQYQQEEEEEEEEEVRREKLV